MMTTTYEIILEDVEKLDAKLTILVLLDFLNNYNMFDIFKESLIEQHLVVKRIS